MMMVSPMQGFGGHHQHHQRQMMQMQHSVNLSSNSRQILTPSKPNIQLQGPTTPSRPQLPSPLPSTLQTPKLHSPIPSRTQLHSPTPSKPQLHSPIPSANTTTSAQGSALVGVGMEFDPSRMIITGLRSGCAAAYSKQIAIGDQLLAVNGQHVNDFKSARDLILGTQGSTVSITFNKSSSGQVYTVPLLRGNADYIHLAEQNRQLNERIAQLESENSRVLAEKAELSGPVSSEFTEITVNAVLQHNVEPRRGNLELSQNIRNMLEEKEKETQFLQKQVAQLQKLIGEKDAHIKDVKLKSRNLQNSLSTQLKDLESVLKTRLEAKNERILELNKQLLDTRAESEGLRTENQTLRNMVQQTNQKLTALISMQVDGKESGDNARQVQLLRQKTASLQAEIERARVSASPLSPLSPRLENSSPLKNGILKKSPVPSLPLNKLAGNHHTQEIPGLQMSEEVAGLQMHDQPDGQDVDVEISCSIPAVPSNAGARAHTHDSNAALPPHDTASTSTRPGLDQLRANAMTFLGSQSQPSEKPTVSNGYGGNGGGGNGYGGNSGGGNGGAHRPTAEIRRISGGAQHSINANARSPAYGGAHPMNAHPMNANTRSPAYGGGHMQQQHVQQQHVQQQHVHQPQFQQGYPFQPGGYGGYGGYARW